ncbi:Zinc metalloproteinase/disintegrin [Hondaea fermentalgiana]|uniref:Zinc metalloproteinase/disintegrin n=1 Tax=Hondaea fermentalgiana TaxID=2315210 RepID=A0A2R5GQV0_9STRA|nr:Zinc metalloproteinase/disintegrin [Hondaea fermentalgiana]|eukprot:GBG31003.1 Zinc metalloproteinase/disintegrin [Hondaea fermentalgiana]
MGIMRKSCFLVAMALATLAAPAQAKANIRAPAAAAQETERLGRALAATIEDKEDAPLEAVHVLEMNQTADDDLELYFEVRNESYTFSLKRFKQFYGAKANAHLKNLTYDENDTTVYDAHFTFITRAKGEQLGVVTIMHDGTAHGVFLLKNGDLVRISSADHFVRKLGADRFRNLRSEAASEARYFAAQVLAPKAGSSDEHRRALLEQNIDMSAFDDVANHDNEQVLTEGRLRGLASCTFPDHSVAYDIGVVYDDDFLTVFNDDEDAVNHYIEATIAESNLILREFANVIVRLKEVTYNDFGTCVASISTELDRLESYAKARTSVAHWHRISGCAFGGVAGVANTGQLCSSSVKYATAVSTFGSYRETFLIFLHELGHVFGAKHPFDYNGNAAGETGGIMDYVYGARKGMLSGTSTIGFTDATLQYFCSKINALDIDGACDYAHPFDEDSDSESVCGDGIISGDEECECPDIGDTKCGSGNKKCKNCKLTKPAMKCSKHFLMQILHGPIEGSQAHSDCCSDSGKLADALTPCNVKNGEPGGYCSLGKCVNRCEDFKGALTMCGVMQSYSGCRQQCIHPTKGYCSSELMYTDYRNKKAPASYLEDGSKCMIDSSTVGMCSSGNCVEDADAN